MYHVIGKIIKIKDNFTPTMEINIIGTSEYLRNDCIPIIFRILVLLNVFIVKNLILNIKKIIKLLKIRDLFSDFL